MFRYVILGLVALLLAFAVFVVRPYLEEVECPYCKGKGFIMRGIIEIPCPYCKSAGKVAPYQRDIILQQMLKEQKAAEEQRKADEERLKEATSSSNTGTDYQPAPDVQPSGSQ